MIILDTLYTDKNSFRTLLDEKSFNTDNECLVRIYSAICSSDEALAIALDIKQVIPNAKIIGSSGSGVIYHGEQHDESTLVVIEVFENTTVQINSFTFDGKSAADVAAEVAGAIENKHASLMHILCGDHYPEISGFIEAFNKLNSFTRLVGGVVGDILPKNLLAYVFTEQGVIEHGIVTASLCNKQIFVFNAVSTAHEEISPAYVVGECNGSSILEIDNKPAKEWCREQFGMIDFQEFNYDWSVIAENDALLRFPLVLEGHGGASRFIKYDSSSQNMSLYFSQLSADTVFRIGYTSPTKCVQESFEICNKMMSQPVESLFCYTCLFRKLYLGNCAQWELKPYAEHGISGVFMMGEISHIAGYNEFLNGSCCIVGVAEKEVYVKPDFSVFEKLYKIKDDNEKLLNFTLQKQSAAMSRENQKLLAKLLQQQKKAKEQLYIDINTGLHNAIKYSQDNQTERFDKMCIVQLENADLLITRYGQKWYYDLLRKALEKIGNHIKDEEYKDKVFYYSLNENTFFMSAGSRLNEKLFMQLVNSLYDKFQIMTFDTKEQMLINRFVIVLHEIELLEKGLSTLQSCRNMQTHFLKYDQHSHSSELMNAESDMLHILNYVIEKKSVIPYFQGIYDNNKKAITKYEALMRICDKDGNIYVPSMFIDIAKKYHLYSKLSMIMLEKVFTVFTDNAEEVSINLSAYDINSPLMCDFILNKLAIIDNADKFIFEILEDENFRDIEILKSFIVKARKFGVKIAIDDFGSGYSNFMEIASIEPDFIKIDGSIIRELCNNPLNQKVLANIVFLGNQMNAELVAEFVESKQLQVKIEELGIHFSQGYYFAKPMPYEQILIHKR